MRQLTRSCFLLLFLERLSLLALPHLLGTCLRLLWSPPSPLHALTLISLSLAKVRLSPTLTLSHHDLVNRTDGSVPFPFGKSGSGVVANCSLCGTEATLSFSAGPVWLSFSAEACALLQALLVSAAANRSAISLLLSSYLTLVLSSPPCPLLRLPFYLKLCGRSGRNCLLSPPVLSDYNGSPDTRFSRGTTRLMSWPDGERYSCPPQSLVVSLVSILFSRTGGVLSHQNSLTRKFPRFPPRNLCSLVMLTVFSLVYAATDTAFC